MPKLLNSLKRTLGIVLAKAVDKPYSANLKDKVVVITGASRGLGISIAESLTKEGVKVINLSRSESNILDVESIHCDLTQEKSIISAVSAIKSKYSKIDTLINNAAITEDIAPEDITYEQSAKVFSTNVYAPIYLSLRLAGLMGTTGLIINIGSKISRNPNPSITKLLYASSKYAIEGASNVLRSYFRERGIRVICLMPGTINTQFSTKSGDFIASEDVADVIKFVIQKPNMDLENIVVKSKFQGNVG